MSSNKLNKNVLLNVLLIIMNACIIYAGAKLWPIQAVAIVIHTVLACAHFRRGY